MSIFNGELSRTIATVLGDSIRKPYLMDLGNPVNYEVDIDLANSEHPGLVWVHARRGDNQIISGQPELAEDDKETAIRALIYPNKIPDELRVYGTPVYVVERDGMLTVFDLGGLAAVEYLYGLKNHDQKSVDISQFDYGLLRPTAPPSGKIMISPFRPTLDGIAYDVPALLTIDLIATYGFLSIEGQAKAVKIETDPTDNTIHYEAGSIFADTTHRLAFPNYPAEVTEGRYLMGWVKLYRDMTRITVNDIYPAQEIYSKNSATSFGAIQSIVTQFGEIITAEGKVVYYAV